jgi:hypothetical protein
MARSPLEAKNGQIAIAVDSVEGIRAAGMNARAGRGECHPCRCVFVEIDVGPEPLRRAARRAPPWRWRWRYSCATPAALCRPAGLPRQSPAPAQRRRAESHAARGARPCAHPRKLIEAAGYARAAGHGRRHRHLGIHEAASGVYGELQPGSFLFMDADYAANERDPRSPGV